MNSTYLNILVQDKVKFWRNLIVQCRIAGGTAKYRTIIWQTESIQILCISRLVVFKVRQLNINASSLRLFKLVGPTVVKNGYASGNAV